MDRTDTSSASRPPEPAEAGVGGARARWDGLAAQARALVEGLDPDVVPAPEAVELWVACGEIARCFTSAQLLLARRVADAGVYKEAGARDTAEYLALRSGVSRASMSQMLATSQRLASQPVTDAAVRAGVLSADQAHVVADAAAAAPDRAQALVDYAQARSLKELRDEALRAKAAADPSPEATRKRQHAERHFRSGTGADGRWWFKGQGLPEDRARFDAALAPLIEDQFHQARKDGRREPRDALVYDALQDMAHRAHHTNHHNPSTNHTHSNHGTTRTGEHGTTSGGEHGHGHDRGERCGDAQSSDHNDETTHGTPADDAADASGGYDSAARSGPVERDPDLAGNGDAGANGGAGRPGAGGDAGNWANSSPAAGGTETPGGDGSHEQTGTGGGPSPPRGERRQVANGGMEPRGGHDHGQLTDPARSDADERDFDLTGSHDAAATASAGRSDDGGHEQTGTGGSPSSPLGGRDEPPGQDSGSESARSTRGSGSAGLVNDPFRDEVDDQAGLAAGLADAAVPSERSARRPPGLSLLPVLRVDLAALQRGYLLPGELCEITSNGPLTLAAAQELLRESAVKLVLTRHGEVTTVAHMERSSPTPTQLTILHADVTTLTCAATAATASAAAHDGSCRIPGVGFVDRSAARELLGQLDGVDVLDRVLARGRDVASLVHAGRQPTPWACNFVCVSRVP